MARELFNSPQKRWVREFFWLPAIQDFMAEAPGDLKYLTFAGPEARDIEFFVSRNIFKLENIRVWEKSQEVARQLFDKYGVDFRVKIGEAFDLCKADKEKEFYPHSVINLDFTNGAFYLDRARFIPHKFELLGNIIAAQRHHTESFLLLLAFAATADVDTEAGKAFVHKTAFDLATRFGHTAPLFNLTRDADRTYPQTLAAVIPPSVIRIGGDLFYDTQCLGKALYFPYNSPKTAMLCFAFRLTYDHPPLSETGLATLSRLADTILGRQLDSLAMPVQDVNRLARQRSRPRRARTTPGGSPKRIDKTTKNR